MSETTTPTLTAALDKIRAHWAARRALSLGFDPVDATCLLDAVDEALKQADHFASEADRFGHLSDSADEESGAALAALAAWQAYDRCARSLREAITRALVAAQDGTGEEEQR